MNIHDLEEIEKSLKVRLPDDYKQTMLQYPFERDSYAAECLLPDDADVVIGHNCTAPFPGKITTADVQPFVVGG
ncbi:MAG: hypothetical protein U1D99_01980, partial [Candidatus Omnitrophota bacterium]|nr:hypothetical protein [Candidatus Omnitrophota bacterium]